ncbi:TPA: c-type cytochrome biogenesis protein CcmI [Klebsiella pneumoniae]
MSLLVVIVALLLAGALGLLYFPWSGKGAVDRDALNRALYQSRLQELAQERGEDNPALVVELQSTLLTDIPPQPLPGERPLNRWALFPGALLLVVLSLGLYLKTSDIGQVLLWQQAERHYPALLQQVKDPAAAFDYASALVRAGDSGQVRMGELLLRDLHQRQPNSLPVLEMLALSAVRNEDYPEAVAALQALLARLPKGDARREAIVRQLAQAQQQAQ